MLQIGSMYDMNKLFSWLKFITAPFILHLRSLRQVVLMNRKALLEDVARKNVKNPEGPGKARGHGISYCCSTESTVSQEKQELKFCNVE